MLAWAVLAGVVATPDLVRGQGGGAVARLAEAELERRRALQAEGMQLIVEGDLFRQKGELEAAVTSYRSAVGALPDAPQTAQLRGQAVHRYAETSVQWAHELAAGAEFDRAEGVLDAVLSPEIDPSHAGALRLKEQLQDPGYFNRALTPEHLEDVVEIRRLLVRAKGFLDLGEYEEASVTYGQVLSYDPYNTAAQRGMETVAQLISGHHKSSRDHTRARMLREVDELWESPNPVAADISGLFGAGEGMGGLGGEARASTARKLREIVLPRVEFLEASLPEVVRYLADQSRALDPGLDGPRGVNIVLDAQGAVDAEQRRLSIALTNVPLGEVLRYVAELTQAHLVIDEFAVQFVLGGEGTTGDVRTVRYRVPPDFISTSATGGGAGAAPPDPFAPPAGEESGLVLQRMGAEEFLTQQGVTFAEGAGADFIASSSTLVVSNTEVNHQLVQQIVDAAFERTSKQLEIRVVMLETTQDTLRELGFDTLMGGFNVPGSDRVFGTGGTYGSAASRSEDFDIGAEFPFIPPGSDVPVGQNPITAGNRSGFMVKELTDSIDAVLMRDSSSSLLSNKAPGAFAVAGVMTDPQFQTVLRALNQKRGVDVSMAPTVVTRSGQRAEIKVIREFPYPIEFDPPEVPQDFGNVSLTTTLIGFGTSAAPQVVVATPATPVAFEVRELGTTLEVEPIISPDGRTVELTILPEFDEFEGYIDYGSPIRGNGVIITENRIVQPVFRTIRSENQVAVYDGATVVLSGFQGQDMISTNDKTPVLADVPLLGRFFRSKVSSMQTRAIVFMVNVKIIDPGGNRINAGIVGR